MSNESAFFVPKTHPCRAFLHNNTRADSQSIDILDEVGKLFERIIATRLEAHMSERVPGWHDKQYGFRRGRSTVDAVRRVRSMAEDMVSRGGVALAVSLDVANAFNAIPWDRIVEALEHLEVPPYLVRVIRAYLSDRWVAYTGRNEEERKPIERERSTGLSTGTPILWITAYDSVLRCPMPLGTGTWYITPTTPWSWPEDAAGTRP